MDFATFKKMVAGYMQRDATTFTYTGVDLLGRAINQARRWAERQRNFELCRVQAQLNVHYTNGGELEDATLDGTATAVLIKTILKGFLPFSDGSGYFPVEVITRDKHVERIARHYEMVYSTDPTETQPVTSVQYFVLVRSADTLYVSPGDVEALGAETVLVKMDATKWLPEYSADGDTDFFMTYCEDFLLMRAVYQLNFMLKEDMRVPVSKDALRDTWATVVMWDSSLTLNCAEDASLD